MLWSRPSAAVTKVGWTFISHLRLGLVCLLCLAELSRRKPSSLRPVPGCDLHQHRLLRLCSTSHPPPRQQAPMFSEHVTWEHGVPWPRRPPSSSSLSFGIFNLLSWASDPGQILSGLLPLFLSPSSSIHLLLQPPPQSPSFLRSLVPCRPVILSFSYLSSCGFPTPTPPLNWKASPTAIPGPSCSCLCPKTWNSAWHGVSIH